MKKKEGRTLFDFFEYKKDKNIIQTKEQLKSVYERIRNVKVFSLDTETTSLKRKLLEWVIVSLGWREGRKYCGVAIPFKFNVDLTKHQQI